MEYKLVVKLNSFINIKQKYGITEDGHVINMETKEIKSTRIHRGYKTLKLDLLDGDRKNYMIHRLVALAFVDNPQPDKFNQINHIDGNKENNHFSNLEWIDALGNARHAQANNLTKTADLEKRKKRLTKEQMLLILSKLDNGSSARSIAREFDITVGTAARIATKHRDGFNFRIISGTRRKKAKLINTQEEL